MADYYIPQHVRVCQVRDSVILLDLKRENYFGLTGRQIFALGTVVHGWPVQTESSSQRQANPEQYAQHVANALVERQLLTRDRIAGHLTMPSNVTHDPMLAAAAECMNVRRATSMQILAFVRACLYAKWSLRCRSLEQTMNDVIRKKANNRDHREESCDSIQRAVELASSFRRLRVFAFTADGHCLFHALALTHFLLQHDVLPTWVIGVRTRPWGAHSWVQLGEALLDASPEQIGYFTPILSV